MSSALQQSLCCSLHYLTYYHHLNNLAKAPANIKILCKVQKTLHHKLLNTLFSLEVSVHCFIVSTVKKAGKKHQGAVTLSFLTQKE